MSDHKLQLIPLGGLGEFGMNCMAIRYGDEIIVVDAGMMFPDAELLGVDIVTPDFAYLEQNREKVRALILTHGHEDHIGAVPFLLSEINMPVYSAAFTLAMVERRLEEHGMLDDAKLHRVKPGSRIRTRRLHHRVHSRHPLHRQLHGAGHHHAARRDHSHRRFQSGPHAHRQ